MNKDLARDAIQAALQCNWEKALELNCEILEQEPTDIDALNRLAKAYSELGDLSEAQECARKVLAVDPINPIAAKSLERYSLLKGYPNGKPKSNLTFGSNIFLEEPGKTKTVLLLHLGDFQTLLELDSGQEVFLSPSQHRVSIITEEGKYIGRLADDLASRLIYLIKNGNEYRVFIKSVLTNEVKIFIKETKRGRVLALTTTFPLERKPSASEAANN